MVEFGLSDLFLFGAYGRSFVGNYRVKFQFTKLAELHGPFPGCWADHGDFAGNFS